MGCLRGPLYIQEYREIQEYRNTAGAGLMPRRGKLPSASDLPRLLLSESQIRENRKREKGNKNKMENRIRHE